jgi:hypothetical protein
MSLSSLPEELVGCVAGWLDIADFVNLSRVSWKFIRDLQGEGTAKRCIEVRITLVARIFRVLMLFSENCHILWTGEMGFPKRRNMGFEQDWARFMIVKKLSDTRSPILSLTWVPQRASCTSKEFSVISPLGRSESSISRVLLTRRKWVTTKRKSSARSSSVIKLSTCQRHFHCLYQ